MRSLASRAALALLPLLLSSSCADPQTAIHLLPTVDSSWNGEREVVSRTASLALVVGAAEGFDGAEEGGGGFRPTRTMDGRVVELRLDQTVAAEADRLPRFRLRPGTNGDKTLTIALEGRHLEQTVAFGARAPVMFASAEARDVTVPFNLLPGHRAPRVLVTAPQATQTGVPRGLGAIYVEFSRSIDPTSLASGLRVVYEGAQGDHTVDGTWSHAEIELWELGGTVRRSTATLQLPKECLLNAGTYRIVADHGVRDALGVALDQDAADGEATPFIARFTVAGPALADTPCTNTTSARCTTDADCQTSGDLSHVCDDGQGDGLCVPGPLTCKRLRCPGGYVCREATMGQPARCLADCRRYGACLPGSGRTCGVSDGLCPCDPSKEQCQTPPSPVPTGPTGLTATPLSHTAVTLQWTDTADNETGFVVQLSTQGEGGPWSPSKTTAPDEQGPLTVDQLAPVTTYWFRVKATGASGDSDWSNTASTTTLAAPDAPATPSELSAQTVSSKIIALRWKDNANNETGYHAEKSHISASGPWSVAVTTGPNHIGPWEIWNLTPATQYWFRIKAVGSQNDSAWSNIATATTDP